MPPNEIRLSKEQFNILRKLNGSSVKLLLAMTFYPDATPKKLGKVLGLKEKTVENNLCTLRTLLNLAKYDKCKKPTAVNDTSEEFSLDDISVTNIGSC